MRRTRVRLDPPEYRAKNPRLFTALEALFSVEFVDGIGSDVAVDAVLLVGATRAQADALARRGLPCLLVASESGQYGNPTRRHVQFGESEVIPRPLRNRSILELLGAAACAPVVAASTDIIMATCSGQPTWIRQPAVGEQGPLDVTSVPLPLLGCDCALGQYVNRDQFLGVLPLLHFLRGLGAVGDWSNPHSHACLVFDDVNLRRESYGCIDFRALAASACDRHFHAAIALIPIDADQVRADIAAIFREHAEQLSILIHGNNHVKLELARDRSAPEQMAILAEARRRMCRLEGRHGLSVCAVAEPPYGVFLGSYVSALVALEYSAVLCTVRQYFQFNLATDVMAAFGLGAAECMPGGLAMIPRIPAAPGWETECVLAAFLGQPIVIAGHHFDADHNLQFIETLVDYVNGLAPVTWRNLSEIASSRFVWRREGTTLRMRAFSREIQISVPAGIETLIVERPWLAEGHRELLRCGRSGSTLADQRCGEMSEPYDVTEGTALEILSPVADPVDPRAIEPPRATPWPALRRKLTEARDRVYPFLPYRLRRMSGLDSGEH